jgi:hypothetical protein
MQTLRNTTAVNGFVEMRPCSSVVQNAQDVQEEIEDIQVQVDCSEDIIIRRVLVHEQLSINDDEQATTQRVLMRCLKSHREQQLRIRIADWERDEPEEHGTQDRIEHMGGGCCGEECLHT